jgi:hypothetical protein
LWTTKTGREDSGKQGIKLNQKQQNTNKTGACFHHLGGG